MSGYTFGSNGGIVGTGSGSLTPPMPPFSAGDLLALMTTNGATGQTVSGLTGWTDVTPVITNVVCCKLYLRIAQPGDASPTLTWSNNSGIADICNFGGNVYTDLSTIVVGQSGRQSSSTNLIIYSLTSTVTPPQNNCLLIAIGRRLKTATSNGATITTPSGFTLIDYQVRTGTAHIGAWAYQIQTAAAGFLNLASTVSIADLNQDTQGFTVVLQPSTASPPVPYPPTSQGGMNVQVCM